MRAWLQSWRQNLVLVAFASISPLRGSCQRMSSSYYRKDGVRITHNPYAPGMAEKYGAPGQTNSEGFDPYADSVGAGIYSGCVQRDSNDGSVVIGKQYQGHNPRPGPVYNGGGYTPVSNAIASFYKETLAGTHESETSLAKLLEMHPDLVNDVATGGASPLHTCGMSKSNQRATAFLISHGADIAAVDTYGYTPLDRMASNNLPIGAEALLNAGADPTASGPPYKVAISSEAEDVLAILNEYPGQRPVSIEKLVIFADAKPEVSGTYTPMPSTEIPRGFAKVCEQNRWNVDETWTKLNGGENGTWYKKNTDDSYVYRNALDGEWWIDGPDGLGVYKGPGPKWTPMGMSTAWHAIDKGTHAPTLAIYRM